MPTPPPIVRRLTGELTPATIVSLPGVNDIVREKLEEFGRDIRTKVDTQIKSDRLGAGGSVFKSRYISSSVVNGKIVPKGIARAYRQYEKGVLGIKGVAPTAEETLDALAEFVAIMKHRAERGNRGGSAPNGRDQKTHDFYVSFWGNPTFGSQAIGKGEGANIFPADQMAASAFDALVNRKLDEKREKDLHKNQTKFQQVMSTLGLRMTDKNYEEYMVNIETDSKNFAALQSIPNSLQEEKSINPQLRDNGLQLLGSILGRIMTSYSRKNLNTYKEDFLKTLSVIAIGRPTPEDTQQVNKFFDFHSELMTSLTDRQKLLGGELVLNVVLTGLCVAGIGEMMLPPIVQNAMLQSAAQSGLSEVCEKIVEQTHPLKARHEEPSPVIPASRAITKAEVYQTLTKKETLGSLTFVGAGITASVLAGPAGAVASGILGLLMYGNKFRNNYATFKGLGAKEDSVKQEHEKLFCEFFTKVQNNADYCRDMNISPDIFEGLQERDKKWKKGMGSTATAMQSLASTPSTVSASTSPSIAGTTSTVSAPTTAAAVSPSTIPSALTTFPPVTSPSLSENPVIETGPGPKKNP